MKTTCSPRIQPVDADLSEPLKSKMEKVFPAALPSPNLYRIVARYESLFIDMIDMGFIGPTGLMDRKTIPPRRRELLILRTCMQARNEYEFHLHERTISERMGLTAREIAFHSPPQQAIECRAPLQFATTADILRCRKANSVQQGEGRHDTLWSANQQVPIACVGHLSAFQANDLQLREFLQVLHSGVCDERIGQAQTIELPKSIQVPQTVVGDLRACQIQFFEVGQPSQVDHSRVGNRRALQIQPLQAEDRFDVCQAAV